MSAGITTRGQARRCAERQARKTEGETTHVPVRLCPLYARLYARANRNTTKNSLAEAPRR